MSDVFRCAECGGDIFRDLGVAKLGGMRFRSLECLNCLNISLLEMADTEYENKVIKINMKVGQKRLNSNNFK